MPLTLNSLRALEILDSRGRPTLQVEAALSDGTRATAQVPSGASTGTHEAVELRDGEPGRYAGLGVAHAVSNVNTVLNNALAGADAGNQAALDNKLRELDGTQQKSHLGANALLGVSCAVARAVSISRKEPLYRTLAMGDPALPVPMINILSGGLHAGANIEFQDFLAIPHGFDSMAEALEATVRIHAAAARLIRKFGHTLTGVADEGGWGPKLASNEEALSLLTAAIEEAGFAPGEQVSIAIDAASSHFYKEEKYELATEKRSLSATGMIDLLEEWRRKFPLVSIEDGLFEDDWSGWQELTARLGPSTQLLGDDFFTTNPGRLRRGIEEGCANAVLVKMNQIGTLSETFEVCRLARQAGYAAVVSARSGETEDPFLADLATATGAGQIKIGSITRSERLAKYNRLLELEAWDGLPWQGRVFGDRILGRSVRSAANRPHG